MSEWKSVPQQIFLRTPPVAAALGDARRGRSGAPASTETSSHAGRWSQTPWGGGGGGDDTSITVTKLNTS